MEQVAEGEDVGLINIGIYFSVFWLFLRFLSPTVHSMYVPVDAMDVTSR